MYVFLIEISCYPERMCFEEMVIDVSIVIGEILSRWIMYFQNPGEEKIIGQIWLLHAFLVIIEKEIKLPKRQT